MFLFWSFLSFICGAVTVLIVGYVVFAGTAFYSTIPVIAVCVMVWLALMSQVYLKYDLTKAKDR